LAHVRDLKIRGRGLRWRLAGEKRKNGWNIVSYIEVGDIAKNLLDNAKYNNGGGVILAQIKLYDMLHMTHTRNITIGLFQDMRLHIMRGEEQHNKAYA